MKSHIDTLNKMKDNKEIWVTMYGIKNPHEDCVINVKRRDLKINTKEQRFYYIWGWPGPDYNKYEEKDYNVSWFFTLEEAHNAGFLTYEEETHSKNY